MLIELAALIYACSINSTVKGGPFVVSFDEPENHLHPSFQRFLLPRLLDAFPAAQFVIATHSPFMVSSVKDSNVYVLRHTEPKNADVVPEVSRWVESIRLDYTNRAGNASEILRDVLGVPVTLPTWVEQDLSTLVSRYETKPMDDSAIAALKADLERAGLPDLFSQALVRIGHGRDPTDKGFKARDPDRKRG
jgi:AAA domain, putative AbiEii toxin, Type IV TA system